MPVMLADSVCCGVRLTTVLVTLRQWEAVTRLMQTRDLLATKLGGTPGDAVSLVILTATDWTPAAWNAPEVPEELLGLRATIQEILTRVKPVPVEIGGWHLCPPVTLPGPILRDPDLPTWIPQDAWTSVLTYAGDLDPARVRTLLRQASPILGHVARAHPSPLHHTHTYPEGEPDCVLCGGFGPVDGTSPCAPIRFGAFRAPWVPLDRMLPFGPARSPSPS